MSEWSKENVLEVLGSAVFYGIRSDYFVTEEDIDGVKRHLVALMEKGLVTNGSLKTTNSPDNSPKCVRCGVKCYEFVCDLCKKTGYKNEEEVKLHQQLWCKKSPNNILEDVYKNGFMEQLSFVNWLSTKIPNWEELLKKYIEVNKK